MINARASGIGDPVRALSKVVALLEAAGARARGTITASPDELSAALARARGRRVLLVGGDGSLHAVANLGLAPEALPDFALLPAGRANNLARALGIPTHWRAAANLAVRGTAKPFDALAVRTPKRSLVAVEGVSAGFHASARTLYEGENSGDMSAGVGAFARAIRRFAPVQMRLSVDGYLVEDGPVAQAFLSNAPLFAYGFRVDPIAKVDDGLLESIVLHASTRRETLSLMRAAHGGRHLDRPGVDWYRAPGAPRRRRAARRGRRAARRDHRHGHRAARAAQGGAAVIRFLAAFSAVAVGLGAARALTTAYVPVLLDEIEHNPGLIGAVMLVNAVAGFAVPLGAGWWSDRRGSRAPFILGGVLVAGGGLAAIALGTASSYLALALAAAAVYVGLNAATTAHRAVVAERFADGERPRATGAQEIAMLLGALVARSAAASSSSSSPALLFAVAAVVVPLLAAPTLALRIVRARKRGAAAAAATSAPVLRTLTRDLLRAARTPGAREVLAAQVLWVFAYVALAPFMVLYADDVLGLGAAAAGLLLAAFGLLTGAGMLAAGALPPERVRPALRAGTLALGAGLLLALPASSVAVAAAPFALAAVGAGVVTALGFPYFARFIPEGEAGAYSGVFFSGRAIASAAALPTAGGVVALTGSYRALLGMGGAAIVAAIPLSRAERSGDRSRLARSPTGRRSAASSARGRRAWSSGSLASPPWASPCRRSRAPTSRPSGRSTAWAMAPNGCTRRSIRTAATTRSCSAIALVAAMFFRRARYVAGAGVAVLLAAFGSDLVLEPFQILFDRPRPEEAIGAEAALVDGRSWAHIASFPSGHLMVTAAMVAALVHIAPRLRWPLVVYLLAVAVTRITFGAHFPLDVVVGGLMGWEVGVFSVALVRAGGLLPQRAPDAVLGRERLPAPAAAG